MKVVSLIFIYFLIFSSPILLYLLTDISFVSDVTEIYSVKITIGNESVCVLKIYLPPENATSPEFDVMLSDELSRFNAYDWVFHIGDLNFDAISSSNYEVNSVKNLW